MSDAVLGERLEGPRVALEAGAGGEYRVCRVRDGLPIGTLQLEEHAHALFVRALCIESRHRGFGAGSCAAALLHEAAVRLGRWEALQAWAPPDAGLAVYFWMRMGLRPIPGDGPNGGLLLSRDLR